ncbi:MAG: C39 family peptidase [Clostridium sp.]
MKNIMTECLIIGGDGIMKKLHFDKISIKLIVAAILVIVVSSPLAFIAANHEKIDKSVMSKNIESTENIDEIIGKTMDVKESIILDVPLICQMPELVNGCEITSLAMLLNYKGYEVDKLTLANEMEKDNTPIMYDFNGNINSWGNPKNGFVGSVYGWDNPGYSIDPEPLYPLIDKYHGKGAINLSGLTIKEIEESIRNDMPVVVWVTGDMQRPMEFTKWEDVDGNTVQATFELHAILITGYDKENLYYNDPLSEYKSAKINKIQFEEVWNDIGSKALTIK